MSKRNFLKQLTTKRLRESVMGAVERMPLSVLFSVLGFGIVCTQIALGDALPSAVENILGKSLITLIVMFILSVAIYFYSEVRKSSKVQTWGNHLVTGVFGLLFYTFFEENIFDNLLVEGFVYIALTLVSVLAALFIAPFIYRIFKRRQLKQREFYIFGYHIVSTVFMAAIVGNVVTLLGFIAWWAITTLFDIRINDIYAYWSAFTFCILAPIFFLVQAPSVDIDSTEPVEDAKFFGFLIKYIGIPAIIFYFVILYLYTIKVLINFTEWPQGEVAWMVIGFSFFGYLIYTAAYVFEGDFKPAKIFRAWLPFAIVPQVAMLFYAIGLRINQYDWTINRYFVVAFGVWLLLISLHFIFSKKKYLGAIPLSLVLGIIIISIGPWSVYSYPEARQLSNLKGNLQAAEILSGSGAIAPIKSSDSIDEKLSGEIYEGIEYICENHGCDTLRPLFTDAMAEIQAKDIERFEQEKKDSIQRQEEMIANNVGAADMAQFKENIQEMRESTYTPMRNWSMIQSLTEYLGVRPYNRYGRDVQGVQQYKNFGSQQNRDGAVRVTGYDYMVRINDFNSPKVPEAVLFNIKEEVVKTQETTPQYNARINVDAEELTIMKGDELVETLSVHDAFASIISGDTDILTFTIQGSRVKVKVMLSDLTLPNPEWVPGENDIREEGIAPWRYGGSTAYGTALIKEL